MDILGGMLSAFLRVCAYLAVILAAMKYLAS